MYDVQTLESYGQALAVEDERVRSKCTRFTSQLSQLTDALAAERAAACEADDVGVGVLESAFVNRFSFYTPSRIADNSDLLEESLQARAAAFAEESRRCERAQEAFLDFSDAAGEFGERLTHSLESVASVSGDLPAVLASVRALWGNGEVLAALWARLQALDDECSRHGVVGTKLALARLACTPHTGYQAVRMQAAQYIEQLELELSLHSEFTARAEALQPWIDAVARRFAPSPLPTTLLGAETAWTCMCAFMSQERPAKARDLGALIELRAGISSTLAAYGRPGWTPLGYESMERDWGAMEAAVHARAAALSSALRRHRAVGDAVARFTADALEMMDWLRERAAFMSQALASAPRSKNEARAVKALVAGYAAEWADRQADLAALRERGCWVVAHRYERADKVAALFDKLAQGMAAASLSPEEPRMQPLAAAPLTEQADLRDQSTL